MVDKVSNYILDNVLYKNEKIEGDSRDIMLFGITRIVEDVPKYIAIIIISLMLKILDLVAFAFLVNILYKGFVGGAHARTNIGCFICSTLYFIIPVISSKFIHLSNVVLNALYLVNILLSVYVIIKIAPADTEEIPIINKKKRKQKKIFAFISLILIYCFSYLVIKQTILKSIIIYMLILINVFCTKPIYKLFRCKYSHESDEFKEYFN